ncbi:hypothetical protein BDV18DRAFT_160189 [Aspergillus unguis]
MSHSPTTIRHRGLNRAATIAEGTPNAQFQPQRRNSTFSDSVSEARNTIRSSTDELFFPRAATIKDDDIRDEESHWHSAPLGLALLPAIAGIFFQNGSAFVTDVTLLALAAVFLNWSVRLPWDWYRSARTIRRQRSPYDIEPVELETIIPDTTQQQETSEGERSPDRPPKPEHHTPNHDTSAAAVHELQVHELAALASCFIFPLLGTWILHTIRYNLSRPSEGLVSNYNLTIFLLAAEIRPFSHLLRMVQSRTLHLQRIIASSEEDDEQNGEKIDSSKVLDLSKRLEELEAHVAETAASKLSKPENEQENRELTTQEQEYTLSLVSEAAAEYRKGFQTDIDALNRAMRKYEARIAVISTKIDTRLGILESTARDALSLAAAAQRATTKSSGGLLTWALDLVSTALMLPIDIAKSLTRLPGLVARRSWLFCKNIVFGQKRHPARSSSTTKRRSTSAGDTDTSGIGGSSKGKAPRRKAASTATQQGKLKRVATIEE